ncbi:MAG: hypothetical protein AAF616_01995 [Bacteroidota bacterium]
MIYTLDHLKDAKKAPSSKRDRYSFHHRNRKVLFPVFFAVLTLVVFLLPLIDFRVLISGVIVILLTSLYLFSRSQFSVYGLKEVYAAFLYSAGILTVPFILLEDVNWEVSGMLFFAALSNLLLFSWFEYEDDLEDGFDSIATKYGKNAAEKSILISISTGISFALWSPFSTVSLYFVIVYATYALLFLNPSWSKMNRRYRTFGDAVFMLPVLFEFGDF